MAETIDLEDVLRDNPAIDPEELRANMELHETLKREGYVKKGYRLAPPYGGEHVRFIESDELDTRY